MKFSTYFVYLSSRENFVVAKTAPSLTVISGNVFKQLRSSCGLNGTLYIADKLDGRYDGVIVHAEDESSKSRKWRNSRIANAAFFLLDGRHSARLLLPTALGKTKSRVATVPFPVAKCRGRSSALAHPPFPKSIVLILIARARPIF